MSPKKLYHNLSVTESVQSEVFLMYLCLVSRIIFSSYNLQSSASLIIHLCEISVIGLSKGKPKDLFVSATASVWSTCIIFNSQIGALEDVKLTIYVFFFSLVILTDLFASIFQQLYIILLHNLLLLIIILQFINTMFWTFCD